MFRFLLNKQNSVSKLANKLLAAMLVAGFNPPEAQSQIKARL